MKIESVKLTKKIIIIIKPLWLLRDRSKKCLLEEEIKRDLKKNKNCSHDSIDFDPLIFSLSVLEFWSINLVNHMLLFSCFKFSNFIFDLLIFSLSFLEANQHS